MALSVGRGPPPPQCATPLLRMLSAKHPSSTVADLRTERCFLGSVLLDPTCMVSLPVPLTEEDFTLSTHRVIFSACQSVLAERGVLDLVLLASSLEQSGHLKEVGGASYLAELTEEVPSARHASEYAATLTDLRLRRSLQAVGLRLQQVARDQDLSATDAVNEGVRLVRDVASGAAPGGTHTMAQAVDEEYERISHASEHGGEVLLPVGLDSVDRVLGGVGRSDVVVLAARPSVGKTALALQIALSVARRGEGVVAVASLEMSRAELVQRALASQSGIFATVIRSGQMTEESLKRVLDASEALAQLDVLLIDEPPFSVDSICQRIRRSAMQHPLRLIVVDYLQLIQGPRRNSRNDEITEISRSFKLLARELSCPVLLLSQLSREVEKRPGARKVPMLSDLRDSGSIEQDADSVLMLYREDYYDPETERKGLVEVHVKKNRHGKTGVGVLRFDGGTQKFTSVDTA